ncbi:glycoside hydrolase superfamily [Trametes elegans]|nr:glycoside hydrolase superfamily [Trametes elegans]
MSKVVRFRVEGPRAKAGWTDSHVSRCACPLLGPVSIICAFATPAVLADNPIHSSFKYGSDMVRGVNLGGWLVLEVCASSVESPDVALILSNRYSWITPTLFDNTGIPDIVDEWTFGEKQDHDTALDACRITGIPGSPGRTLLTSPTPASTTLGSISPPRAGTLTRRTLARPSAVLKRIVSLFANDADVVAAIASPNEPADFYSKDVVEVATQYWHNSYDSIRVRGASKIPGCSDGHASLPAAHRAAELTHANSAPPDGLHNRPEPQYFPLPVSVGEWPPAITDCARYLNGRGVGARYDGTLPNSTFVGSCDGQSGSGSSFSGDYKTFLRQSYGAQIHSFEKAVGWFLWMWKGETSDDWSYQAGLKYGWIPKEPTDRKYRDINKPDASDVGLGLNIDLGANLGIH